MQLIIISTLVYQKCWFGGIYTQHSQVKPFRHSHSQCTCMHCQFCSSFIHLPTLLSWRVQQILNMDQQITPQDAYCQLTEPSGRCQASGHICIQRQKISTACQKVGNCVVSAFYKTGKSEVQRLEKFLYFGVMIIYSL